MAAKRKKAARKAGRRNTATRQAEAALARLEQELPTNLRDFSRRVQRGLAGLEREIEKAQANPRREAARLLREASHALGRFEAEGERRWRKLTAPARREALRLLHRLEGALAGPKRRKPARKVTRRRVAVGGTGATKATADAIPGGRLASVQPSPEPT
jgi:hypothetical protein